MASLTEIITASTTLRAAPGGEATHKELREDVSV